jgi:hypothetical protein
MNYFINNDIMIDLDKYFTDDSVELIRMINDYLIKFDIKFKFKDINLVDKIVEVYGQNERNVDDVLIELKSNKENNNNNNNNRFISKNISNEMEMLDKHYVVNSNNLNLNIFFENKKINLSRLVNIYDILLNLVKSNKKAIIDLHLIKYKKCLNHIDDYIGPVHVNSGSTTNRMYIQIWRIEELYKVFIHELIHFLEADFVDKNKIVSKRLHKLFNVDIKSTILPFEAYTEMIAVILNCIITSCELYGKDEIVKIKKTTNFLLLHEIYFSLYQTAKILKFFEFENMTDFLNKNEKKKIKQESSIFSYYIVKSALLFSLCDFLEFIDDDIVFAKKDDAMNDRLNDFCELIIRSLHNKKYISEINNMCNEFEFNDRSMRMTLTELK